MTKPSPLEPAVLESIIAEAIALDRQIKDDTKRLKSLKSQLIVEASFHADAHVPTDGGGSSWVVKANTGEIVRVTFPGHSLKDKIDPTTKEGSKLIARFVDGATNAARKLKRYFRRDIIYRPLDDFRARVEQDFPPKKAESLISACEKDSDPTVSFETASKP